MDPSTAPVLDYDEDSHELFNGPQFAQDDNLEDYEEYSDEEN